MIFNFKDISGREFQINVKDDIVQFVIRGDYEDYYQAVELTHGQFYQIFSIMAAAVVPRIITTINNTTVQGKL